MLPFSEPAGRVGTWRLTVPSSKDFAQPTPGVELWILASAGEHAVRPAAAEGFSVIPSGIFTTAVFSSEASISSAFGWRTNPTSAVKPVGSSWPAGVGDRENSGWNGTLSHPDRGSGLVNGRVTVAFSRSSIASLVVR